MDFLFHKVSENEKKDIQKQAKKIMNDFSKQLNRVNKKVEKALIERDKGEREESNKGCNDFSREIMFDNAPEKSKDFIVAEEKKW